MLLHPEYFLFTANSTDRIVVLGYPVTLLTPCMIVKGISHPLFPGFHAIMYTSVDI